MNKRKMIALIIAAGVFLVGAGVGTYAWFTSRAVSADYKFASGKLLIDVNGYLEKEGSTSFDIPFKTSDIKPGDMITTGDGNISTITIQNKGTLPMATLGRFFVKDASTGADLTDVMLIDEYKIDYKSTIDGSKTREPKVLVSGGTVNSSITGFAPGGKATLKDLLNMQDPFDKVAAWNIDGLRKNEEMVISFKLEIDPEAGDLYQGQDVTLRYEIAATQPKQEAIIHLGLSGLNIGDGPTANAINTAIGNAEKPIEQVLP